MLDYMNTVQLFEPQKTIFGDVFYKWSRTYAALGRYCDAISPIEMYVSLDPANRRTPQTAKIINDYAEKGNCNTRYATGAARVSFAGTSDVRTLTVVVNGVAGNLILDTCAYRKLTLVYIGGAVRPKSARPTCDRRSGRRGESVNPCAMTSVCELRCNIFDMS
jgi:hypothetical protein